MDGYYSFGSFFSQETRQIEFGERTTRLSWVFRLRFWALFIGVCLSFVHWVLEFNHHLRKTIIPVISGTVKLPPFSKEGTGEDFAGTEIAFRIFL
jgi:hypothetical protein